jgi:hypothetical protein
MIDLCELRDAQPAANAACSRHRLVCLPLPGESVQDEAVEEANS